MASKLKRVTGDGAVHTGTARLKSVTLTAGSDGATVAIDDSTDGNGTDVLSLKAAANTSAEWVSGDRDGVLFTTAIYADLTGTSPSASIEYEVED